MALKDWSHPKRFPNSWIRKDGVELSSYGMKQKYPFIHIGKNYDSKVGKYKGYAVERINTSYQETLKTTKTKALALKFAKSYMRRN